MSDLQSTVFKNRGALLALPALALIVWGKPSWESVALGLPLAILGEALRCWGVGYSGLTTRADHVIAPQLVTAGPYAHVRNPLYTGNFITALGFAVAFTGRNSVAVAALLIAAALGTMIAVYSVIVPYEEAYLRTRFGFAFEQYCARVPRLIPRAQPAQPQHGVFSPDVIAKAESRTLVIFALVLAALAWKALRP